MLAKTYHPMTSLSGKDAADRLSIRRHPTQAPRLKPEVPTTMKHIYTPEYQRMRERLLEARKVAGLTQEKVAANRGRHVRTGSLVTMTPGSPCPARCHVGHGSPAPTSAGDSQPPRPAPHPPAKGPAPRPWARALSLPLHPDSAPRATNSSWGLSYFFVGDREQAVKSWRRALPSSPSRSRSPRPHPGEAKERILGRGLAETASANKPIGDRQ